MARVVAYPVFNKKKSVVICTAFINGVPARPGLEGNVFYGVTDVNAEQWRSAKRQLRDREVPLYYIDNSYFDKTRGTHYRVTKNAIQFKGPFKSDGRRFAALGYTLKPWRPIDEGHVVVCPQSETFYKHTMQSRVLANEWLRDMLASTTQRWLGREVRVREWSPNKPEQIRSLRTDLVGAGVLITHSSAAAVEAIIEGVHVHVEDTSALAEFDTTDYSADGQRQLILNALADNQWTLEEIERGDAWRWLNR